MKKKILSMVLATSMVATMFVGCGTAATTDEATGDAAAETTTETADAATETVEEAVELAADTGKTLNIYCWNEEFKSRLADHYDGYEEVDGTHGKIGDVDVVWNITPSTDNAYQNNLDEALLKQADAADEEKIDIFLVEADYALKYVDTEYTMAMSDLGITDEDTAKQYQYTKDVVTDSNGAVKGLSWQACPGVLFYNREVAKEVLGTDDPDEVQEYVKDWATFNETADKMVEAGYHMTSSVMDTYRVYSNNVSSKWVEDGKINIDDNIMNWINDSMDLYSKGATSTCGLWSDDWSKGFYPEGKVFCYFGPAWLINFCMAADQEGSVGYDGGWGAATGPQGFFWGGTWICAATGTDNANLVADIIKTLTCDDETMKEIVEQDDDFANNKDVMEAMAADTSYSSAVLGGQNPLGMYCAGVETIDLSKLTSYDQGCNEAIQNAIGNYFDGTATLDEALDLFYTDVQERYPELTK